MAALLVVVAVVGAVPAAQADANLTAVHSLAPAPGEVVGAGSVSLRVTVTSAGTVELAVDGVPVPATPLAPPAADGSVTVGGSAVLAAGEREAHLRVTDGAGTVHERRWRFVATERTVRRIAGADRVATAVAVSGAAIPDRGSAPAAVLARVDALADALAGAPLAVAVGGPLLLAAADAVPPATAAELERVLPPGATVHLLGGEAALGPSVRDALEARGYRIRRHGGVDRYATAAAIARALPPSDEAIVASGEALPDALAASVPAARHGLPVLLTAGDRLPAATAGVLRDRGVAAVSLIGGPAAVAPHVEDELRALVSSVDRVAGADRWATAAAILDAFPPAPSTAATAPAPTAHSAAAAPPAAAPRQDGGEAAAGPGIALASGHDLADALAGAPHAAAGGMALLLTARDTLPAATREALRRHAPGRITVYGGPAAVSDAVIAAAVRAAVDGPEGPRALTTTPEPGTVVTALDTVAVAFDRPVDPARSTLYLEVGGIEVPLAAGDADSHGATLVATPLVPELGRPPQGSPARLVVAAASAEGSTHLEVAFTWAVPDPVYATTGGVVLHRPSPDVQLIGFHESNHDGAQQQEAAPGAGPTVTLPSRGRGTPPHSAADIVASPDREVLAPVTGTVIRAGSYVLYCDHRDEYVVVAPDAQPGWEVKVLHIVGVRPDVGDRVEASRTVLADHPRTLPFRSQVDDHSDARRWPHVHVEVVDPAVPDRPGEPC